LIGLRIQAKFTKQSYTVFESIGLNEPAISGNEWKYVKECLDTGWVSSAGKYVDLFEKRISEYTKAKYAIACVNGTSAIQLSLLLSGLKPDDEVLVPTITFIAPVNAVYYNGAVPIFMDCDDYYNIDIEKTIDFIRNETKLINVKSSETNNDIPITINKKTSKRVSAIIPVHVWGNAVWLDELLSLCLERNISVVEDASESLGTFYSKGNNFEKHSGTLGKLGCLSFNGNKIITAGGGGMILTNDKKLAEKARYLTTQAKDDPIRYIHDEVGYNLRLTNIQAALGVAQLENLPNFLKRKKEIHFLYAEAVEKIKGMSIAIVPDYANNNHWMNLLQIESDECEDREMLMRRFDSCGIQTRPVWAPNHLQKPYRHCQSYKIEKAEQMVNSSLCLPSSSNLTNKNIGTVIAQLNG
jgi:perosamine synthetase